MALKRLSNFCIVLILLTFTLILWESPGFAVNTEEQNFSKYKKQILKNPKAPESVIAMDRLIGMENRISEPERIITFCKKVAKKKNLSFDMRLMANRCLYNSSWNTGDTKLLEKYVKSGGRITRFKVIGPFDNEAGGGMDLTYEPETEFDPDASYKGKERQVQWRDYPAINQYAGRQYLGQIYTPSTQSLAYAYSKVYSKKAQKAVVVLGVGGEADLWLNGQKVGEVRGERDFRPIQTSFKIKLKKGVNNILLKIGGKDGDWSFALSLLDYKGRTLKKVYGLDNSKKSDKFAPFEKAKISWKLNSDNEIKIFPMALDKSLKKFEKKETAKQALLISKLYDVFAPFSIEENLDEEYTEKALELEPQNKDVLLWCNSSLSETNKRLECLLKGKKLYPKEPLFDLKLASFYYNEGLYLKARAYLDAISDVEALELRRNYLFGKMQDDFNWSMDNYQNAKEMFAKYSGVRNAEIRLADLHDELGQKKLAYEAHMNLLKSRPGATGTIRWLYNYHLNRKEVDQAMYYLNELIRLMPGSLSNFMSRARINKGLGKIELAKQDYNHILEISPEDTSAIDSLAMLEHRFGEREKAIALWKRSLEIYPQNPDLEEYMRELKPEKKGFEAPFVKDIHEIIAKYPMDENSQDQAEKLLDLTVWKVFENGLSSKFNQSIVRPLEKSVLKQRSTFYIHYSPFQQNIKIIKARIVKPNGDILERFDERENSMNQAYKIYFDNRVRVVSFPDAEPGDVVELQYRLDDVANNNMFADYYGTLQLIQDSIPRKEWETIVLMPKDRELYHNQPRFAKLEKDVDEDGFTRFSWKGQDIPRIHMEPNSPPLVEIADYLHLSTFKDWNEMGTWYWGLVQDQFIANDELKNKVHELVDNIAEPEKKVEAIYNWVVTNTRYVGLEFGIHGYKPYQVNQIFKRKFGDCKDKATLLIAMLKEAGIKAYMAIIRTSNIGKIQDYPPSLSMFNHAIAYLPDYDLYLDGTAEFSGMHELPYQDRRGQVMLVSPDFVDFTQVKPVNPDANLYSDKSIITLNGDNMATIQGEGLLLGSRASSYRSHFQEKERRSERFEKIVNREHPGSELVNVEFSNVEDISSPVEFKYTVKLKNYIRQEGEDFLIWANYEKVDLVKYYATISKREYPVTISRLQTFHWETEIDLGEKYKVKEMPESVKLASKFGEFETSYKQVDNKIFVRSSVKYLVNKVSVEDYLEFRKYCQQVTQAHKEEIRLSYEQ